MVASLWLEAVADDGVNVAVGEAVAAVDVDAADFCWSFRRKISDDTLVVGVDIDVSVLVGTFCVFIAMVAATDLFKHK